MPTRNWKVMREKWAKTLTPKELAAHNRSVKKELAEIDATPAAANPKEKFGAQKPALGLIPPVALAYCATAMEDGARKYGAYNWRTNPVEAMTYTHAGLRHILNYLDGERLTSDTGVHNLGAAMACFAIVLDAEAQGTLIDNRPPAGKSAQVQDALKAEKKARAERASKKASR